jgi:hypothetical protein
MTNYRAITASYSEIVAHYCELFESGKIEKDKFGNPVFNIVEVDYDSDICTLVWLPATPKPKKERIISLTKHNKELGQYGYDIGSDGYGSYQVHHHNTLLYTGSKLGAVRFAKKHRRDALCDKVERMLNLGKYATL